MGSDCLQACFGCVRIYLEISNNLMIDCNNCVVMYHGGGQAALYINHSGAGGHPALVTSRAAVQYRGEKGNMSNGHVDRLGIVIA